MHRLIIIILCLILASCSSSRANVKHSEKGILPLSESNDKQNKEKHYSYKNSDRKRNNETNANNENFDANIDIEGKVPVLEW